MVPSIVKRAVAIVRNSICEAVPGDLEELHTEVACKTFGKVQYRLPEHLVCSTVQGAVDAAKESI